MTPKSLVLHLLSVHDAPFEVALLVRAGAVFGFEAGAVRVTLSRLQQAGHIESPARGLWRLGASAARLAGQVATWRELRSRVRPWSGGWIGVATGGLSRSDRAALRRHDRALSLLGFRALRPGLQLRPDNRREDADTLRLRLVDLGLGDGAPVFPMGPLGPVQAEAEALWSDAGHDTATARVRDRLQQIRYRLPELAPDQAARETFLAGSEAIRLLAFDPLLPAPMVDPEPRWALVDEMLAFDALGRDAWRRVLVMQEVAG